MSKYLELFLGEVGDLTEKTKLENKPYVAYSSKLGKVVYTVVPKNDKYEVTYLKYVTADELKNTEYQVVDLGLSSGTKWLDRNIGAKTADDCGAYFTWGNTDGVIANTVLMTLEELTEFLVGADYTEEDMNQVKIDVEVGLLTCFDGLVNHRIGDSESYNKTFGASLAQGEKITPEYDIMNY